MGPLKANLAIGTLWLLSGLLGGYWGSHSNREKSVATSEVNHAVVPKTQHEPNEEVVVTEDLVEKASVFMNFSKSEKVRVILGAPPHLQRFYSMKWIEEDPVSCVKALNDTNMFEKEFFIYMGLSKIAQNNFELAAQLANSLDGDPYEKFNRMSKVQEAYIMVDPMAVSEMLLDADRVRPSNLANVFEYLLKDYGMNEAISWLEKYGDTKQNFNYVVLSNLDSMINADAEGTVGWLMPYTDRAFAREGIPMALRHMVASDPMRAVELTKELDITLRNNSLLVVSRTWGRKDERGMLDWALGYDEPGIRDRILAQYATDVSSTNSSLAYQLLDEIRGKPIKMRLLEKLTSK